jgi:tetratricopeptide (TPR) repeat protein
VTQDPRAFEALLARSQALRAEGEWGQLHALLEDSCPAPTVSSELPLLLAESELRTGSVQRARDRLRQLVAPYEAMGDGPRLRRVMNMLGVAELESGDVPAADAALQRALELASAAGDHLVAARVTNNLGALANLRGQRERALSLYQLAVPAFQQLGSDLGLAETYHNLAITHRDLGQLDQADRCQRRALDHARGAGNARMVAMAHVGRADLLLRQGEAVVAEAGARLGAEQYAAISDALGEADALRLAGEARTVLGRLEAALDALDRAVQLARRHGGALLEAEALEARARLNAARQDWERTVADASAATTLYRRLEDARAEALPVWVMATVPRQA